MRKEIVLLSILVIGLALVMSFPANKEVNKELVRTIKIGEIILNIEIADTEAKRIMGLSGKDALAADEGLLFIFEKEGYYGIWMKDMRFPIDIAWLDKNKKIVHLEKDVLPQTYPKVFTPFIPSLYVLEVNAGFFENSKVKIGDLAEF